MKNIIFVIFLLFGPYLYSMHSDARLSLELLKQHSQLVVFSARLISMLPGRINPSNETIYIPLHYTFALESSEAINDKKIPVYSHCLTSFLGGKDISINLKEIPQYGPGEEIPAYAKKDELVPPKDYVMPGNYFRFDQNKNGAELNNAVFFDLIKDKIGNNNELTILFTYIRADRTSVVYSGFAHKPPEQFKVLLQKNSPSDSNSSRNNEGPTIAIPKTWFSPSSCLLGFVSGAILVYCFMKFWPNKL